MHSFQATILKFSGKGEKTSWTYVEIPPGIIQKLELKNKKGFRIRGFVDDIQIEKLSTYPIGEGNFIVAINSGLKKKLGKKEGAVISIKFELDKSSALQSKELLVALREDKIASAAFRQQLPSQQNYFHRYVATARTAETRTGRIVNVLNAMIRKQNFGEMIRSLKK